MIAATKGNLQIVEMLLAEGVDIKQTTQLGNTALSAARKFGRVDVVAMLEAYGRSSSQ